jgi:hypothetical protein
MENDGLGNVQSTADFWLFTLLGDADIIVKLVLVILLLASVWSWIVIGEKFFSLGGLKKASRDFEEAFWSGRAGEFDLRPGQGGKDPASRVFVSAAREWQDAGRSVATPSEAFAALKAGAAALKLFPAEGVPPEALRAWRAVVPASVAILPVGGITPEKMALWRAAGASGFGLGSALYRPGDEARTVGERARRFVAAWDAANGRFTA